MPFFAISSPGLSAIRSNDWIPIYDKTSLNGHYVAIGTSGNQFKNDHDHDIDPVQVTLPRTGHKVDLSHYSRKRHINRDSSFSVMG